jgi:hypothetical protein
MLLKQKLNKKKIDDDEDEDDDMENDNAPGLSQRSNKSKKGHGHGNTTQFIDILPNDEKELRLMLKEVKKSIKQLEK